MNKRTAIKRIRERLSCISDNQMKNIMENLANGFELVPLDKMTCEYIDDVGRCWITMLSQSQSSVIKAIKGAEKELQSGEAYRVSSSVGKLYKKISNTYHCYEFQNELNCLPSIDSLKRILMNEGKRRGFEFVDA